MKISHLLLLLFWLSTGFPLHAFAGDAPANASSDDGKPIIIANAKQYALSSKLNGQDYRLMVYVPPKLNLDQPQPVFYVLDGSYYFAAATDAVAVDSLAGIVVGVGYPTDDREEVQRRRTFDLSLPNASGNKKYGGADAFLNVLEKEIKPFIAARYKIDPAQQSLYGHSLGGLTVLRQLFKNPTAYSTYVAASPSIWWNDRAVLVDEPAFSKRAKAGELHLKILITSAGDEQYHGDDKALQAKADKGVRMISNATELAARLSALDPADMKVTREIFPDETHVSGSIASLCRGLKFALPVMKKQAN
jgi:predicted alpha/beta superfamily hydrolase